MNRTLDDLETACRSCERCALSATRTQVVAGEGPFDAPLVLVGEAPGRLEDESGHPFVGRSGQLLLELLEETTRLTRSDVFITNTVRCRPPDNRTPTTIERSSCAHWLDGELQVLSAPVIVAVGATATRALLGHATVMRDVHGTEQSSDRTTAVVVPAFHPAAALRGGAAIVDALRGDLAFAGSLATRTQR